MDIQRSLSSAYASVTNFTRNVGNTVSHYGSRAIEQGRLGANHIVSEAKHRPGAAAATTAFVALAILGSLYMFSGSEAPVITPEAPSAP